MFKTHILTVAFIFGSLGGLSAWAQALPEGVKCLLSDEAASVEIAADYRGGKVYFCCENCAEAFNEDTPKYAVKANRQLVQTGQFEQTKCPLTGGDVDESESVELDGIKVLLCCAKCTQKVTAAADEADAMIFADEVFEKSFAAKSTWDITGIKCFIKTRRDIREDRVVDHLEGKVFLCCPGCVNKWNKAPEKYTTQGNLQLVQTGQYQQTKCPISGGDVDAEKTAEVDGVTVKFCCERCQGKVVAASTDEAKRELVFGEKSFAKGFAKK